MHGVQNVSLDVPTRGCEVSLTEAPHTHTHDDPHLPRLRETKERLNWKEQLGRYCRPERGHAWMREVQ